MLKAVPLALILLASGYAAREWPEHGWALGYLAGGVVNAIIIDLLLRRRPA